MFLSTVRCALIRLLLGILLRMLVSSQHLCNVVFTGAPGVLDLQGAADTAEGAHVVVF